MTTAADLKPGQSAFDHDFPARARYVHSVEETTDGEVIVRWGHPDQEPESADTVPAGKEYELIRPD
jgi:hypothetical protein